METGTWKVKTGLAQMLKGGVIMDIINAEQAKIAQEAEKKNITPRVFNFALELNRKRIIPSYLVRLLAPRYFERRLR